MKKGEVVCMVSAPFSRTPEKKSRIIMQKTVWESVEGELVKIKFESNRLKITA